MSLENYKKNVENYLKKSVSEKEANRLMTLYTEELNEFFQDKLDYTIAGTLILQGY